MTELNRLRLMNMTDEEIHDSLESWYKSLKSAFVLGFYTDGIFDKKSSKYDWEEEFRDDPITERVRNTWKGERWLVVYDYMPSWCLDDRDIPCIDYEWTNNLKLCIDKIDYLYTNSTFDMMFCFLDEGKEKTFVKIKYRNQDLKPIKATEGSAGYDVFSPVDITLEPNKITKIPLGFSLEIPKGYVVLICPRSSYGLNGIVCPTSIGVIDSDYRGELNAILLNINDEPFEIKEKDRIGQLIMIKYNDMTFLKVAELSETTRGEGGFGSTGV